MANSAGSYQSPAKCQFCQESEEIKWLCFSCNLKLCVICNRKIHSLIEAVQNHKVIALKDINSEEASDTCRRVDLEKLTCEVHEGQKCVSFCLDCHVTLCLICFYEEHKDHNKKELLKLYDENVAAIQKVKQDVSGNLSLVDDEEKKLTKMSEDKSEEYKKVKNEIDKKKADFIAEVKKYSQKLHNEVDTVYQPILTEIKTKLSEVQQTKVQLKEKQGVIDNILHSHQARDVLHSGKTIEDIPVPQQSGDIPTARCLFTPGDSLDSKVRKTYGEVNKIPELELVKTYQTKLEDVKYIINWNKNEKIIFSSPNYKLQRVRFDNDTMTVIEEEGINVYDMAVMENGDVVIFSGGSELKIYTKEGFIKPYKSFLPLITMGVHVNRHNEVLVGLTESPLSTVTPDSIQKVVVLNQSGDIQHTYQYTRDKQRLFTSPDRIITCQDIICVVDILSTLPEFEGRVVALDYGGHVQWVYNGEENESHKKIYPTGMAVTPTDLILICDFQNHAIHILNPRGQVIVCHQAKNLGVEDPWSLCVDNESLLWVGCRQGKDKKANIHTMTIM